VTTESEQGRLGLDESCGTEDDVSVGLVRPALLKVWEPSCETLYADDFGQHEAGRGDLVRELLGAMEERSREPVRPVPWVRVPPIGQVALNDVSELRVEQVPTRETVEQRGESADGRNGDQAVGSYDSSGFLENSEAVGELLQVVERPEHEYDIEAVIWDGQPARISYVRRQASVAQDTQRLANMARRDVEEMHAIALREEPVGMHSGPSADIEDLCGWSR
jgi:hypothetical protein